MITTFPLGSSAAPWGIVEGPDGNLWFTQSSAAASAIGRITPGGVITLFTSGLTAGSEPEGITVGPDGNLWFTENAAAKIGTITPSGVISEYAVTAASAPTSITTGGDGNLWFTEESGDRIGQMSPSGALLNEFTSGSYAVIATVRHCGRARRQRVVHRIRRRRNRNESHTQERLLSTTSRFLLPRLKGSSPDPTAICGSRRVGRAP